MSASLWSGDASLLNMPEHIATQHAPVLPPPVTLSGSQLPAPGAVAIVATDTPLGKGALPLFKSALESVKGIELQYGAEQVNEKTRAIIWLDSSAAQMGTLEELLVKYKDIGFVQMPMAGINAYSPLVKKYKDRVWTSAKVGIPFNGDERMVASTSSIIYAQADMRVPLYIGCIRPAGGRTCLHLGSRLASFPAHAYSRKGVGSKVRDVTLPLSPFFFLPRQSSFSSLANTMNFFAPFFLALVKDFPSTTARSSFWVQVVSHSRF